MTVITISTYEENGAKYRCLTASEHAGSEVVCAGISAICYALAGYLLNKVPEDDLEYSLAIAEAEIRVKDSDIAREAFTMAEIGLKQIEETYGDYIHVEIN